MHVVLKTKRRRREKIPTVSSPHLTFCETQLSMGQDRAGRAGRVYWQLSKQIKIDKFLLKRTQYLFMDCHPIKIVINPSSNQFSTPIRSWAGGKCKCLNLSHFYWASEGLVYGWSQLIRFDTFVTVTDDEELGRLKLWHLPVSFSVAAMMIPKCIQGYKLLMRIRCNSHGVFLATLNDSQSNINIAFVCHRHNTIK